MISYSYLNDSSFLKEFDKQKIKEQYIKITALDFISEMELEDVEGKVISGNLNLSDGAVRRNGNLTMIADDITIDLKNLNSIIAINKKIKIEIGFTNKTGYYNDYDKIWFPLGIFVITSPSIAHNLQSYNISISFEDKMCLLNGNVGGKFPAATDLLNIDYIDEDGNKQQRKATIREMIMELVNHFGGEQIGRILIDDLESKTTMGVNWLNSKQDVFFYKETEEGEWKYFLYDVSQRGSIELPFAVQSYGPYQYGDYIGQKCTDFTYPAKEFVANIGETISSALDKIKNTLVNYEYFYDINGNFIFREIKNYLNTTKTTEDLKNIQKEDYLIDRAQEKSVYSFEDNELITNINIVPNYNLIKNDFIVWGEKTSLSGTKIPIRYHLAIAEKPKVNNLYKVLLKLVKYDGRVKTEINNYTYIKSISNLPLNPTELEKTKYFYVEENNSTYYWYEEKDANNNVTFSEWRINNNIQFDIVGCPIYLPTLEDLRNIKLTGNIAYEYYYYVEEENKLYKWTKVEKEYDFVEVELNKDIFYRNIWTQDYRTELYLQGLTAAPAGVSYLTLNNDLSVELKDNWHKLFHLELCQPEDEQAENTFKDVWNKSLEEDYKTDLDYFLDIIDSQSEVGEFSINNIGKRSEILNNKDVNCVFEPPMIDFYFIPSDNKEALDYVENILGCPYLIFDDIFSEEYEGMTFNYNSAFEAVRDLMYQYTNYNDTLSISCIPIFYLDVNNRITIRDTQHNIYGDYIINSISIPFGVEEEMSISASKALQKI